MIGVWRSDFCRNDYDTRTPHCRQRCEAPLDQDQSALVSSCWMLAVGMCR